MTTIDLQPPCDARAEAIRANLRLALADQVKAWQVPQSTAAARLGIGRSTLNNILNHDNRRISIASLITMLSRAGADVSVEVALAPAWPEAQ